MAKQHEKLEAFIDDVEEVLKKHNPDEYLFLVACLGDNNIDSAEASLVKFEDVEHLKTSLYEMMQRNPVLEAAVAKIVVEAKVVILGDPHVIKVKGHVKRMSEKKEVN